MSCTVRCGVSSTIAISLSTTSRSESTSWKVEAVEHVGHDVERGLQALVRHTRVHDRGLPRGGGVELAAELVEELRDLLRRVARGALEEQVLDEVRDARAALGLVTRACADPEAERDRAHVRQPLGDDALAGLELGELMLGHAQDRTRIRALTSRAHCLGCQRGNGGGNSHLRGWVVHEQSASRGCCTSGAPRSIRHRRLAADPGIGPLRRTHRRRGNAPRRQAPQREQMRRRGAEDQSSAWRGRASRSTRPRRPARARAAPPVPARISRPCRCQRARRPEGSKSQGPQGAIGSAGPAGSARGHLHRRHRIRAATSRPPIATVVT